MRPLVLLALLLLPGGCGKPATPEVPESRPIHLGMTPAEVSRAAGPPDRQTLLHPTPETLEIIWAYKRNRRVVLEDPALEGEGPRVFPKGCILTFGENGRCLTAAMPPEAPADRPIPQMEKRPLPPVGAPLPPEEASARVAGLLSAPPETLQPAVDRVMVHFRDCLPWLVRALDGSDQPLPEDLRVFLPALPGEPAERLRRVRPRSRLTLVLQILNQGTGQHFGTPEDAEEMRVVAGRWKAWQAGGAP